MEARSDKRKTLWRVSASYFVAGFLVTGTRVTTTAPILYRFKGKSIDWVRSYCRDHGWNCRIVHDPAPHKTL